MKTKTGRMRRLVTTATLTIAGVAMAGMTSTANAATPVSPGNGTQLTGAKEVVVSWALDPGWEYSCLELTEKPETAWAGGPFLSVDEAAGDCDWDTLPSATPQQTSERISLTEWDDEYWDTTARYGTFFWHVKSKHLVCTPSPNEGSGYPAPDVCKYEASWGPIASFSNVAPPKPVKPDKPAAPTPPKAKPDPPHLRGYRFCGWRKFTTRNIWTFKGPEPGAFTAMYTKGLTCHIARRNYAKVSYGTKRPYRARISGYRCKTMHKRWEYSDIRCAKKGRHGVAFRYQSGV